jgi:hypothetical protein
MSPEEITTIVHALPDLVEVLSEADPADKIKIYEQLGLKLTYNPGANAVDVELETLSGPGIEDRSAEYVRNSCARGGFDPITPRNPWVFCDDLHLAYSAP